MAEDSIIKIVVQDQPAQGAAGGTPPTAADASDKTATSGDEEGGTIGKILLRYLGRMFPGGRETLKSLGVDKIIEKVGSSLDPVAKEVKEKIAGTAAKAGETGAGSSATASAAALGEAAGPVGAVLLAVEATRQFGDALSGVIRDIGSVGADLVSNNPGPALHRAAEGAINFAEKINPMAALVGKTLLAVADAAGELSNAFLRRANELAGLSPAISFQQAMAEVRGLFADLREERALGERYARIVELRSQTDTALQDALEPVKELLADLTIPVLEKMRDLAEFARDARAGIKATTDTLGLLVKWGLSLNQVFAVFAWLWDVHQLIERTFFPKQEEEKLPQDQWNDLIRAFTNIETPAQRPAAAPGPVL